MVLTPGGVERVETAQVHRQTAGGQFGHLLADRTGLVPSSHKRRILLRFFVTCATAATFEAGFDRAPHLCDDHVSIVERQPGGGHRRAERDASPSPARSARLPLRIAARPPETATGTIGACALIAMTKPPFLNGSSSPVRLRVPSGKMRNELPARSASAARSTGRQALLRLARSSGTNPASVERPDEHRQLPQLGLVEDAQPRKQPAQRENDGRRLDVAAVIAGVDGAPPGWMCSSASDARRRMPASAKPSRTPRAPAA